MENLAFKKTLGYNSYGSSGSFCFFMEDKNIQEQQNQSGLNNPKYDEVTTKFFKASLINIPLFAVPAFTALFLGKFLDKKFETDKTITLILLLLSFIFSWVMVLRSNKKLTKEYKAVRKEMMEKEKVENPK